MTTQAGVEECLTIEVLDQLDTKSRRFDVACGVARTIEIPRDDPPRVDRDQLETEALHHRLRNHMQLGAPSDLKSASSLTVRAYRFVCDIIDDNRHTWICFDIPVLLAPGEIGSTDLEGCSVVGQFKRDWLHLR
jgi:hypothetical protein